MTNCVDQPPASLLEWDTEFFGRRIAQASQHTLEGASAAALIEWCRKNQIECLYLLAEANDAETVRQAERYAFNLVDVRVTLAAEAPGRPRTPAGAGMRVEAAQAADIPALREMARTGHRNSRFYYDGHFDLGACDRLYETWIEKSCRGYADCVLVTRSEGQVLGYVTCHLSKLGPGKIGLVGVDSTARGQQVGQVLVSAALDWFDQHGAEKVVVTTQGRNLAALRLYTRCGFLPTQVQLWYHRWLTPDEHEDA